MEGRGKEGAFTPSHGLKEFLLALKEMNIKIGLVTSGLYEKAWPEILSAFRTLEMDCKRRCPQYLRCDTARFREYPDPQWRSPHKARDGASVTTRPEYLRFRRAGGSLRKWRCQLNAST